MARSGRWAGATMGVGTLSNYDQDAGRKIFAILSGTTGNGGTAVQFTQGETYMSAVDAVFVTVWGTTLATGTGSVSWEIDDISGGTFSIGPGPGVGTEIPFKAIAIGSPDINRIP